MVTFTQKTLDFNRKIKLSNDGGFLSSDTGEFLFSEFDEKIGFSKTLLDILNLMIRDNIIFIQTKTYCVKRSIKSLLNMRKMMLLNS